MGLFHWAGGMLSSLTDVRIVSPSSREGLYWDANDKKWKNGNAFCSATFGDVAAGNYAEFETDGTLKLNGDATVWDDMRILPSQFDRPGTTDPTIRDWQPAGSGTTFKVWCFDPGQAGYFTIQVPHSWKVGSSIWAHVHWTPHARGVAEGTKTVGWALDYSVAGIGSAFPASGTLDLTDACQSADHHHLMSPEKEIAMSSVTTVSAMLVGKLYRVASGDTWVGTGANGPALLELDFHFELDTIGSRQIREK